MGLPVNAIAGLVCAVLLGGCMSVADFRQTRPVRVTTVAGNYLPLASCVMSGVDKLQGEENVRYQFLNLPSAKSASILGVSRLPGGLFYTVPEPVLELTFKQGDEGKVSIEARSRFPGATLEPRAWPIVERCAGTRLTLVPPLE
ncbi:MAG: hypothetical protein ACRELA_13050 [Candidatus Rokuibacteriota bacterium]